MNYQIKPIKLLKTGILLSLIAPLVWSCENDEVLEEISQEETLLKPFQNHKLKTSLILLKRKEKKL